MPATNREWLSIQKHRLMAILRELELPETGRAIHYGCGDGWLASGLAKVLPGWEIHGVDEVAVIHGARDKNSGIVYHTPDDEGLAGLRFDLVVTHHLLDRTPDLGQTLALLDRLAAPRSRAVHILACGNAGSLEQRIASARPGGVMAEQEGRFVFDDPHQLRRPASAALIGRLATYGYAPEMQRFADQWWGAADRLTEKTVVDIVKVTRPWGVADREKRAWLGRLRWWMILFSLLRRPVAVARRVQLTEKPDWVDISMMLASMLVVPFLWPFDAYFKVKAANEWGRANRDPRAAEMYLVLRRRGRPRRQGTPRPVYVEQGRRPGGDRHR